MTDMKFCVDCKWHQRHVAEKNMGEVVRWYHNCTNPKTFHTDMVTGEQVQQGVTLCESLREGEGWAEGWVCGSAADGWEAE